MKTNYIVCYDIRDEKRLVRVYRYMRQWGVHLQYSLFHSTLTWQELGEVKQELGGLIDAEKDDIRIYPLPADMRTVVIGCGDRVPDGVDLFLP